MKNILKKVETITKTKNLNEINFIINEENHYLKLINDQSNGQLTLKQPLNAKYRTQKEAKDIFEKILEDENLHLITTTFTYEDKKTKEKIITTTAFNDKKLCVKETLIKRKLIKEIGDNVKVHVTNYGTTKTQNHNTINKITDVAFAEMPLHV